MSRKTVKFRASRTKNPQNRLSMFLVSMVVVFIVVAVAVKSVDLRKQKEYYTQQIEQLDAQLAEETKRTADIEEYRKYTQTKKYAEEVAKDKLGLMYEDEIFFRQE